MRIALAYLCVVLLWATTPLAIKWSGEGPGFLFAVTSRMAIGLFCLLFVMAVLRRSLFWNRKAWLTYLAVAVQVYGSMMAVYWGAQFIPSGWVSVIFGFAPLMTALLVWLFFKEGRPSLSQFCAYCLGIAGLYIMFGSAAQVGEKAHWGIIGILIATFLQTIGAVWIKELKAGLPALTQVTGGLTIALPAYLVTWWQLDGRWSPELSIINIEAILYLGVIATTIGFSLYYYLLTHLSAIRVALISLMTPVMSLILGHLVNQEPLNEQIITGTAFILVALLMHEILARMSSVKLQKIKQ